jgi:hypothetical protein
MFGSSRKMPGIPNPRTTSCWCIIHQHTLLAANAASGALGLDLLEVVDAPAARPGSSPAQAQLVLCTCAVTIRL